VSEVLRWFAPLSLALGVALTGCGASDAAAPSSSSGVSSTPATTMTIKGYISVPIDPRRASDLREDDGEATLGELPCAPKAGYDDIRADAQVTVTDESGTVLGLGFLTESGLWVEQPDTLLILSECRYDFSVSVPEGAKFLGVEVAHRGVVRYTAEQAQDELHLTLG
jgi:hypothetical protein